VTVGSESTSHPDAPERAFPAGIPVEISKFFNPVRRVIRLA
jgi:hypothetical protein